MIHRSPPIIVIEMVQNDFLNFKDLLDTKYVHRKVNTKNEPVSWNKIKWMQYKTDSLGFVSDKYSFDQDEFLELSLARKSFRKSTETNFVLKPIATTPLPLPIEKLKDLQSFLPLIRPKSRLYYNSF